MKIRNGFVSNSSSSSFIIAFKGKKPTIDKLMDLFGVAKNSPAEKLFNSIFEVLLNAEPIPKIEIKEMREYDPDNETLKLLTEGWTVLQGSAASDTGDPSELFLCASEIDISTNDLKIIKSAQY